MVAARKARGWRGPMSKRKTAVLGSAGAAADSEDGGAAVACKGGAAEVNVLIGAAVCVLIGFGC